jgi:feruloyl esterase
MTALGQWVEKGVPPEEMLAAHFDLNGNPDRTRPLCACPKVALYSGSESIDDASNFSCVAPRMTTTKPREEFSMEKHPEYSSLAPQEFRTTI